MTEPFASLTNQFLIAMPGLNDPNFTRTVTYLCQHSDEGALGIIVNRPSEITLSEIMTQMGIAVEVQSIGQIPVYVGGPVQPERGFILHEPTGSWGSTLRISESISLTTSRDILEAIGQGKGPSQVFVALGYAGWGKGQLEREIGENSWLNVPASDSIIFVQPAESRWKAAAGLVGVDISALTAPAGHA